MNSFEREPRFLLRTLSSGVLLSLAVMTPAQKASAGDDFCDRTVDFDCDGIVNALDRFKFNADEPDVDGDGIPNRIDLRPYDVAAPDVDGDGIRNALDQQPYLPNIGLRTTSNEISRVACISIFDSDCDGIIDIKDRFPNNPDLVDADYDGLPNRIDSHPYVPGVRTDVAALLAEDPNFCYLAFDNDCDGIDNRTDLDDYVPEFSDVDGDGIPNKSDQFPYYNPDLIGTTKIPNIEPSRKFHIPVTEFGGKYYAATMSFFLQKDTDRDGLIDMFDPYRFTADWDGDGIPDGYDSEISYDQGKAAEKRREDSRLEHKSEEQRLEEKRIEAKRRESLSEEQRLEEKRLDEKILSELTETRRLEEMRLEAKRLLQLTDAQRFEENRIDNLHEENRQEAQRIEAAQNTQRIEARRETEDIDSQRLQQEEDLRRDQALRDAQKREQERLDRQRQDDIRREQQRRRDD